MLKAFLEMKEYVIKFTDISSNGLSDYILTDEEWEAVEDLVSSLKVFVLLPISATELIDSLDPQGCYRIFFLQFTQYFQCHTCNGCYRRSVC